MSAPGSRPVAAHWRPMESESEVFGRSGGADADASPLLCWGEPSRAIRRTSATNMTRLSVRNGHVKGPGPWTCPR
jgi:hypothetical protein